MDTNWKDTTEHAQFHKLQQMNKLIFYIHNYYHTMLQISCPNTTELIRPNTTELIRGAMNPLTVCSNVHMFLARVLPVTVPRLGTLLPVHKWEWLLHKIYTVQETSHCAWAYVMWAELSVSHFYNCNHCKRALKMIFKGSGISSFLKLSLLQQ